MNFALLIVYLMLILVASLVGGWIPLRLRLTHARLELGVSFVAGVMLGVGVLHLLPHAVAVGGSLDRAVAWLLVGFLAMFLIERFFRFHFHDAPSSESPSPQTSHTHAHGDARPPNMHELRWGSAAVGLTLHGLIEGVALAASMQVESVDNQVVALAGLGTFLVIFLHKPFDSLTLGMLLAAGGRSPRLRHVINVLFALVIPLGAALLYFGTASQNSEAQGWLAAALAFSAGTFVCIASSDLLPELHFHRHDRTKLSIALIAGITLAWLIGVFESSGHDRHDERGDARRRGAGRRGLVVGWGWTLLFLRGSHGQRDLVTGN